VSIIPTATSKLGCHLPFVASLGGRFLITCWASSISKSCQLEVLDHPGD
jgi:hypothetical protein